MREPRFVRRRVSGETPTVKCVGVKVVIVKHVPGLDKSTCQQEKDGRERFGVRNRG